MNRLEGKIALVTGSTQGLGEGIAMKFAREGAIVIVNGRSQSNGDKVLERLRQIPAADAIFLRADLSSKRQAQRLVDETIARFGGIDILVNNAQSIPPLAEQADPVLDKYFDQALCSGLYASMWTSQAAFPSMLERGGGRIVNFASINGSFGSKFGSAYNATKEAIRGLTRTMANEWGRYGITVNVVLPAGWSPSYEAFYQGDPKKAEAVARLNPMRRHGRAEEDIGSAVLGLVSDSAGFITGQSLYIDGGANLLGLPQLHTLESNVT